MRRVYLTRAIGRVLASFVVAATINSAMAGSFTRGCAARDLQVLKMIEEHESDSTISDEKVSDALLQMMHARLVCYEGRVLDALALYDVVIQSITANPVLSERRP